jgi:hypothetical protein
MIVFHFFLDAPIGVIRGIKDAFVIPREKGEFNVEVSSRFHTLF